ncbi:transposase [Myxococcus qinghaiensis]|uniref:transposase n=1 Tax=Myxococcus qinghaiensis TaxID=2906758 RepID=UPI0020A7A7ED|nr:transposase [Myxococcus qinghaiensis]MCP3162548.1 transposase [Myxococcus qinghaiensis]
MKKQQKQDRTAERGRFSAKRKKEAVLRLLKGEELDALSRELGVTAAVLSEWREKFLAGAKANLKSREPEPADDEVPQLKAMVGELMMKNELFAEKARLPEWPPPEFAGRELRKPAHLDLVGEALLWLPFGVDVRPVGWECTAPACPTAFTPLIFFYFSPSR